jgi:hypothetical protein
MGLSTWVVGSINGNRDPLPSYHHLLPAELVHIPRQMDGDRPLNGDKHYDYLANPGTEEGNKDEAFRELERHLEILQDAVSTSHYLTYLPFDARRCCQDAVPSGRDGSRDPS